MATVPVAGGNPDVIAWVQEHGFAAEDLSTQVTFNDDGTVTLHRFVRDDDGNKVVDETGPAWVTEPVTVTPTSPFPGIAEVTGR